MVSPSESLVLCKAKRFNDGGVEYGDILYRNIRTKGMSEGKGSMHRFALINFKTAFDKPIFHTDKVVL